VGPTLTERHPEVLDDVDTRLAEASNFNQTLLLSEEGKSDSPKSKATDFTSSQKDKQKA
jgi:hypothetical protein